MAGGVGSATKSPWARILADAVSVYLEQLDVVVAHVVEHAVEHAVSDG